MTAGTEESTVSTVAIPAAPEGRLVSIARLRGMGVFLIAIGLIGIFGMGLGAKHGVKAVFLLASQPATNVSPITMPVRPWCIVMSILCALVGVYLAARTPRRGGYLIFGVGVIIFMWAFLVWAARGGELSFVQLLAGTLVSATPLVYGALSGVMCERSGVVNIAIEGQFLAGAFLAAMIDSASHHLWLGVLAGAASGALFGAILAFLSLRYGADQIIVGVVIVAFCTGLTNYLTEQVLTPDQATLNSPSTFSPIAIPLLSKIPVIGPVLFNQNIFVYGAAILLVVVHVALFYTKWGLRVRSVGEHPQAAATVGIHVLNVRYRNVILGGVIAGLGGASFTIGSIGEFSSDMTAGLGYVALAAMIFGRWRPFGALSAALLFGFAVSLQSFLAVLNVGIPSPILSMAPYVITIAVVSGLVGRVRPPAADGVPYVVG
ncbi:MAG TPA: ABC transporter permease [Mycobacteriales bacterium]|nr:ABC transporter permease [Mycobacteriales bacterium]